ncbi:Antibacterial factor-related peptide 2 [Pseudolycoriella hygida]|uniref:Antibacterial factor-related peptide 2 n=1 Tax=Pseudolycoriella hygida TaxID=35572 RepID=A0A9Q0MU37_9DIPT|nr:Antibacterial factor-related peptide 2 [Pseudolycoriella hygida]
MRITIVLACLVILATTSSAQTVFTTCARMNDGPIGAKVAQGLCIVSCSLQNCGTGTCQYRGRPVCVCSRCGVGSG